MNKYILLLMFSGLAFSSCKQGPRLGSAPEALRLALRNVEFVTGDNEAQNQLRLKLSRQSARLCDFELGMLAADQISGASRGAAFGMLAWEAANRGYDSQAKQAIHKAENDKWISTDAEVGLKQAYLAGAFERLGKTSEARSCTERILDSKKHNLANALCETARIAQNPSVAKMNKKVFTPDTILESVDGLIPVFEDSASGTVAKRELLGLMQDMVVLTDAPSRVDCLSKIAVACGHQNLVGDASLLARQALEFSRGFDPRLEMYAIGLSQTSLAFSAAKEKTEAVRCLELAAERPQLVAYYFQPQAISAIALGYQFAGEPSKANEYWLKAIQIAKSHPHPRARQINVVLVLSSMAEAAVTPSPEILSVIDSIRRGEGGDAPLPPGYVKVGDTKTNAVTAPPKQDKKEKKKKESKVPAA
jgi:tetratricopeptide (TPR) repeat protein